jgi:nucleotide-binding universal stress UspA family protein
MTSRILLPVDLAHEPSWTRALPEAAAEARMRGAALHLLAIVPDFGMSYVSEHFPPGYEAELVAKAMAELRALAAANLPDDVAWEAHVAHGHPAEEILKAADSLAADLIVMASHKPDTLRTLLVGSVADRIVHNASQSVLVVRNA